MPSLCHQHAENAALRSHVGTPDGVSGVIVRSVPKLSNLHGQLQVCTWQATQCHQMIPVTKRMFLMRSAALRPHILRGWPEHIQRRARAP
jgi:hypothetical protein